MKLFIFFLLVFLNQINSTPNDDILEYIANQINIEKIKTLDINKLCIFQIEIVRNNKDILSKMIDASAKYPYSGMIDSGRTELGNFDECIEIDHTIKGVKILGKYCFAGIAIPDLDDITNANMYHKLATCVPGACSAADLLVIANATIFEGFPSIFIDDFCSTKDTGKELSIGNIICIFIILLIFTIAFFSTIYDVYCEKKGEKPVHPLLLSFSVVQNTKNILKVSVTPSKETIQIFNGFRVISIAWIIAGHASQLNDQGVFPIMNKDKILQELNSRKTSYLFAANLAVTTFFFMSGFLVSFLYFKRKPQNWLNQVKSIPLLYIHRYIRLTAPLIMIYIMVLYIFDKLGNGPLWQFGCDKEKNICKKFWWSYFLYIQNYVNWDEMCLIPLWYLSADMQLFLLAPLILIPTSLVLNRRNGFKLAMLILALVNIFFVSLYIAIGDLFPKTTKNDFNTHGRLAEYFIGLMMGVFMRFKKEKPFFGTINRHLVSAVNIIIWIVILVPMFCLFLFSQDAAIKFEPAQKTLFNAFGRFIWAVGLSWMVYSCYHGYGGFINWILCRPLFQVLGKLSYSMYLIHYIVLGHYTFSNRMKWYMSHYTQFYLFCGYFIETIIVSFIWSLVIESPILTIEKYFFSTLKNQDKTDVSENNKKDSEFTA